MRIIFYLVGSLLIILGGILLLAHAANDSQQHQWSGYALGIFAGVAGIALVAAAIGGYRGGWKFILGILAVAVAIPFIFDISSDYLAGRLDVNSFFGAIILSSPIAAIGVLLLVLGHKKHLRTPAAVPTKPAAKPEPVYVFRDLSGLHKGLRYMVAAYLIVCGIGVVSSLMQYQLLSDLHNRVYASREQAIIEVRANDHRQQTISSLQVSASMILFATCLAWTYRASANTHALGAASLAYSPRMAVAWYFVPFANIWHPYQAMKEIWQASFNPASWKKVETHYALPLWWFLYLLSNGLGVMAFHLLVTNHQQIARLAAGTLLATASTALAMAWAVALLTIVGQVQRLQAAQRSLV